MMKRSLRQGRSSLHVTYGDTFSNNLVGENFVVDVEGSTVVLSIDLSPNLRTRNKSENSYADALDLAEHHADLDFIQVWETSVAEGLARTCARIRDLDLQLQLSFAERGTFSYKVRMESMPGGVQLTVHDTN